MNNSNLRTKLLEIQKAVKTFATTENSEKKDGQNPSKSAYLYTPSWKIVETIRQLMDDKDIMLDSTLVSQHHEMISYPVYKEVNRQIIPFEKKEMYVILEMDFTWVDVNTGETIGPIRVPSTGANGTDKSLASAMSLCERYFFLKQFHITTHEQDEEADAHDSSQLPGNVSYPNASEPRYARGIAPMGGFPQYGMQEPARPAMPSTPAMQAPMPAQPQSPEALYEQAVEELMKFGSGTASHNAVLNKWLTILCQNGYDTSNPKFSANLVETAQARREGRQPQINA